jgi:V/A-type H+-transporting ATPase subunit D
MLAAAELPPAAWAALAQVDETQPPALLQRILGVALPQLEATRWRPAPLGIALPPWADEVAQALREQHDGQRELGRRDERIRRLDAAHRRTMQRVNLFERVLVPRARAEIRSIVVRLADLERAAIVRAKRSRALLRRHAAGAGTGP